MSRRYGVNLWGEAKNPVNVRNYTPGQHGPKGAWKITDYGKQLAAKQKLKAYYGNIGEKQFRKIYEDALRRKGDTSENLLDSLERRLASVVYRLKFVPTVQAARQVVNHGLVRVNGKRIDIPSYRLRDGDEISLAESMRQNALVVGAREAGDRTVPAYIEDHPEKFSGVFLRRPDPVEIPYPIEMNPRLVIEFYSR